MFIEESVTCAFGSLIVLPSVMLGRVFRIVRFVRACVPTCLCVCLPYVRQAVLMQVESVLGLRQWVNVDGRGLLVRVWALSAVLVPLPLLVQPLLGVSGTPPPVAGAGVA